MKAGEAGVLIALAYGIFAASTAGSSVAHADEARAGAAVLEEVIVTAQKRSENLQDVPIAVTALSQKDLWNRGVNNIEDLDVQAPNLKVTRDGGITNIFIRGIGNTFLSGGDGSVAFNQDGVYMASYRSQVVGLFDVDRIEVLRGPQGTLYGRNATGGAINVVSNRPAAETSGYFVGTVGNFRELDLEGAVGGSLSSDQSLMGRVAAKVATHSGYGEDITTGTEIDNQREASARLSLLKKFSDAVSLLFIGDYFKADDSAGAWSLFGHGRPDVPLTGILLGGVLPTSFWDVSSSAPPHRHAQVWGANATLDWKIDDAWAFKAITAYRRDFSEEAGDYSGTNIAIAPGTENEDTDQFTEELQLSRSSDRLDFLVGAYYLHEKSAEVDPIRLPLFDAAFGGPAIFIQNGTIKTEAYALFANAAYKLTDRLAITLGGRYSYERKSEVGSFTEGLVGTGTPINEGKSWDAFTPKGTVDYKLADDVKAYLSVGKGFKSGTFASGEINPPVDPEYVVAYEIGLKSRFIDGRLQLNMDAFYYDYNDLQVSKVAPGPTVLVENAAKATTKGFEIEVQARPWRGAQVTFNGAYLDARFKEYLSIDPVYPELGTLNLAGNYLPTAPKGQITAILQQSVPAGDQGKLTFEADATWTALEYFDAYNLTSNMQKANTRGNLRATYDNAASKWSYSLWVRNVSDAKVIATSVISANFIGFPQIGSYDPPRTFGADLRYRF